MMRLATKSARVYHQRSPLRRLQYAGGSWNTRCGRIAPEVSKEECERRGLLPCRACMDSEDR